MHVGALSMENMTAVASILHRIGTTQSTWRTTSAALSKQNAQVPSWCELRIQILQSRNHRVTWSLL